MSYTIYFLVQTNISTNLDQPVPGANITWGSYGGAMTDGHGRAQGKVTSPPSEYIAFDAWCTGYSSQTLNGNSSNDSSNPLTFTLQYTAEECFIVSAATGSKQSAEVARLQQIRARIAVVSSLSNQLIGEILRGYYQFSPGIAADIKQDGASRKFILETVVRPLIAWYNLAVAQGLEGSDPKTTEGYAQAVLDACSSDAGGASVAAAFEAIRSGAPAPKDAPPAIARFTERVSDAARLPAVSWAIFDPLARVWSLAARQANPTDEVSEWLAAVPLETLSPPSESEVLDADLAAIASFFDFHPEARKKLGTRMAAAWPQSASALAAHGFA